MKFLIFAGLILGIVLGVYALFIEPSKLKVVEWDVETEKWTYEKPLKIALIADPHAIWPWMDIKRVEKIVDRTNALQADLILLLGDYTADHPFGRQLDPVEGVKPYERLSAPCGVFAVLGNHDFPSRDLREPDWTQPLIASKVRVLQNEALKVSCDDGRSFWVGG